MAPYFRRFTFPLRATLVTAVIFTIVLTICGTAIPAYYNTKKSVRTIWGKFAQEISEKTAERVLRYFMAAPPAAQLIEGLVDGGEIDIQKHTQIFDVCYQALMANKDLTALFFVRPDGSFAGIIEDFEKERYLASHRMIESDGKTEMYNYKPGPNGSWISIDTEESDYDPRKRPYWPSAVAQPDGGWSQPYPFLNTTETGFSYTLAQQTNGKILGYWVLNFQINFIARYLKELNPGEHGTVFIVADDGKIIADSSGKLMGPLYEVEVGKEPLLEQAWAQYINSNKENGVFRVGEQIFYADRFPKESKIPWSVITLINEADFLLPLQQRTYASMAIGLFICALFAILASIFFGRISHRLKEVAVEMDQVGDLGMDLGTSAESHSLIREVNTMNTSLGKMKIALRSFAKYLPLDLVKTLIHSGHLAELGGEKKEISLLFADLANFTQVAERLSPDELVEVLDTHLTSMTTQVQNHGGIVDKYIGDAVMAIWGAPAPFPDHPLAACRAALAMKQSEAKNEQIKLRIGINTGNVMVGNFGSKDRMDYTAIGDPVNLASRLETLNRIYGTRILIGDTTAHAVQHAMVLRPIDFVTVKGKSHPMLIHELIGEKTAQPHPFQPAIDQYAQALAAYRNRRFEEAATLFDKAAQLFGTDAPSTLMAARCRAYQANPPPSSWDGSKTMEEK